MTIPFPAESEQVPPADRSGNLPAAHRPTRVIPPADVIKLEDRLAYVLQPPLESLLQLECLRFARPPFRYQFDGIAFLFARHHAVLADEMGLGKTMQTITAIRLLMKVGEVRRVLLVCPKPLVIGWQRELALWAPEVPVVVNDGSPPQRHWHWQRDSPGVLIANYELLVRDQEQVTQAGVDFDLVVLDEAQRIKNKCGATSKTVCGLRRRRSWALTGTPVENSPDDLLGLFEFVCPGLLTPGMKTSRLGKAVDDYILRRTKDRVLEDLPPKLIRDAEVDLTPEQFESYQMAEDAGVVRLNAMGDLLTVQHVFELIIRLKQICNFDPVTGASRKLERLEADLEECVASGRKAIVFSQWVATLEHLAGRLSRFGPLLYHGRTPARQRDGILSEFRDNPDRHVVLMSYGAGGVGLNLQFAGFVFLFDRWWNPAVEDQAIARAHRIGAAGPVTVTRFLTVGTIEERIDAILQSKRELFAEIFAECGLGSSKGLSKSEVFGLFDLEGAGMVAEGRGAAA